MQGIKNHQNLRMLDSVFLRTLNYKNGDLSETLYILMFVFLQHRTVRVDLPAPLPDLNVQLLSPDLQLFLRRNQLLPRNFLVNSSGFYNDDRDKLSHFFGSAFLSYNRFGGLTLFIGNIIECTEYLFVEDNFVDSRDLEINRLGLIYGELLRKDSFVLPSTLFILYNMNHFFMTAQ